MSAKHGRKMTRQEMARVLEEEDHGVLAMSRKGEPYAVPLSYAFIDGSIVFHSKTRGRKLDFLRANPKVCFSVSRHPDPSKPHHAEKDACTFRFESVLAFGRARLIEDAAERLDWLKRFKAHFDARLKLDPKKDPVDEKAAKHASCVVIDVGELTGRRKGLD